MRPTKQQILDYLSDIIDREKAALDNTPDFEISEKAEKFRQSRSTKKLFAFFEDKGYHIISLTEKQSIPRDRSQLASLLTKNRKILFPFIKVLIHTQDESSFPVENESQETLTCLLNTCKNFSDRNWIRYEYDKKEKIIKFAHLDDLKGEVKHFLSGIFGEYGTAKLIEQALQKFAKEKSGFKYKIFHDIKLKKPDSDKQNDMQLDLVVQLPEGFYIFETKMGKTLAIGDWVDRTRLFASEKDKSLEVPSTAHVDRTRSGKNRFITCCADETLNPKIFQPFRLFNLEQLKTQLTDLLQKDYPSP